MIYKHFPTEVLRKTPKFKSANTKGHKNYLFQNYLQIFRTNLTYLLLTIDIKEKMEVLLTKKNVFVDIMDVQVQIWINGTVGVAEKMASGVKVHLALL